MTDERGEIGIIGLGTLINTGAILAAGLVGHLFGKVFDKEKQDALTKACGITTVFIGIAGAMEGMLKWEGASLKSGGAMLLTVCLLIGTAVGELLNAERAFETFGDWLKVKTGNAGDSGFLDAFLTASFTVCIGAMTIVGALEDGMNGDSTLLCVKAVLDFIIVSVLTSSMGKGAVFSAIPVFVIQGVFTVFAGLIAPVITDRAIGNLSLVGSVLIFCVGINLVFGKKIRVANMLPSLILAVSVAYLPLSL